MNANLEFIIVIIHVLFQQMISIKFQLAMSTGVRNRKSLVHQETLLFAEDHDFTKLSLTLSVIFFINIPKTISDSFYDRNVYVSYKNTIF